MLERMTPEAERVISKSLKEALQLGCFDIRPEHLLLAMLQPGGIAHLVFARNDNWHESSSELRQEVISYLEQREKQEVAKELSLSDVQIKELTEMIREALLKTTQKNWNHGL